MVKASFRRNRGKGAWVRHARYLAREHAQHELERGRGFDASFRRASIWRQSCGSGSAATS